MRVLNSSHLGSGSVNRTMRSSRTGKRPDGSEVRRQIVGVGGDALRFQLLLPLKVPRGGLVFAEFDVRAAHHAVFLAGAGFDDNRGFAEQSFLGRVQTIAPRLAQPAADAFF